MSNVSYNPEVVKAWIADDPDERTAKEVTDLLRLAEDGDAGAKAELADRFDGELTFGTAGLRGHLGGGPNRMNRAVVRKAAAGLSNFLHDLLPDGFKIVIGYDARYGSADFALDTAKIAEAAGGHAYIFDQALPTPLTAFALQHLDADAAVVVTASHNPKEDNGYKVYLGGKAVTDSGQGAQIVPPYDAQIFKAIQAVKSVKDIPMATEGWTWIGEDIVKAYLKRLEQIVAPGPRDLRIVLTSMHGVGGETMVEALKQSGFDDIHVVVEQHEPNPDFPTVKFPNPEEPGALDLSMALAQEVDADLILANDPDADRCSAAVRDQDAPGGWRQLTGNQVGALLGEEAVRHFQGQGEGEGNDTKGAVVANSIVSSRLLQKLAKKYGVGHRSTLTGFKWISRVPGLVYGFEEALGYCVDPSYVKDKDGISACLKLAVMAARQKAKGLSLQDILDDQSREFGVHATAPLTIRVEDLSLIALGMQNLRTKGIRQIAGSEVVESIDLAEGTDSLPPTDGLLYLTGADDQVVVRPSGTEPKLKCYIETIVPVGRAGLAAAEAEADERLETIKTDMRDAMGI